MLTNLSKITQSHSVAFADHIRSRELEGKHIIKMQTGDPDFDTHPKIVESAYEAMLKGDTKYCDSRGTLALRSALAEKVKIINNIDCSPFDNILITHGAVHGIGMALRAIINPGDECIIIEPYWRAYEMNVLLAGGVPVIVQASREHGFQIDVDKILKKISRKTRVIIINTPNNPSGAIYRKKELVKLAAEAANNGIYIVSDEVYESIVFDGNRHYSIASEKIFFDWIITAFSFSKTYAMTGWRLGYLVAGSSIINELLKLSQFTITSLAPFVQVAAITALQDDVSIRYVEEMRRSYEARRKQIATAIKGTWLDEVMTIPDGTFYSLIDVSRFDVPSIELSKRIVDVFGVSFTPGIAFGDRMDNYLRMCFATSERNIDIAIETLKKMDSQNF